MCVESLDSLENSFPHRGNVHRIFPSPLRSNVNGTVPVAGVPACAFVCVNGAPDTADGDDDGEDGDAAATRDPCSVGLAPILRLLPMPLALPLFLRSCDCCCRYCCC